MAEERRIEQMWRERAENYPTAMYEQATAARARGDLREVLDSMLHLCTHRTPDGMAVIAQLVDDLAADGDRGRVPEFVVRRMAWQLVQYAGLDRQLLKTFFREPPRQLDLAVEFRACLLQEMVRVLHVNAPEGEPGWLAPEVAYHARLAELGHPLAWLPLRTFDFEHRLCKHEGQWADELVYNSYGNRNPEVPPTPSGAAAGHSARELTAPERTRAALAPFTEFIQSEVRFHTLSEPLDPADFNGALLSMLPADCLADTAPDTVRTVHTTGDQILGDLYMFADTGDIWTVQGSRGGEWGHGRLGAYGRLDAWRALYALMGLAPDVPLEQAVRNASECRWLRFSLLDHTNEWFANDGLDRGTAVLDAQRTGVAILATTEMH